MVPTAACSLCDGVHADLIDALAGLIGERVVLVDEVVSQGM